jgi:hypothetical protein
VDSYQIHHGIFENDAFRRAWLTEVARQAVARWKTTPDVPGFATRREAMLDRLADAVERHLDMDTVLSIIERGPPKSLPFTPPGVRVPVGRRRKTDRPPRTPSGPGTPIRWWRRAQASGTSTRRSPLSSDVATSPSPSTTVVKRFWISAGPAVTAPGTSPPPS